MNTRGELLSHDNIESPQSEDTNHRTDKTVSSEGSNGEESPSETGHFEGARRPRQDSKEVPWNDKDDSNDKNVTGRIPAAVYRGLPRTLAVVARNIETDQERDVFLTGALPVVAGACPNVRFKYGGQWLSPNLYTAVIAPAASGKGKMRQARKLADPLNQRLHEQSQQRLSQWKDQKGSEGDEAGPRPPYKRFYLPADNSAASLKEGLGDSPNSVIFETEFKTFSNVLNQEWGQFRDVLLKGFQNEPVEVDRKTEKPKLIRHPAPSIAVSGTPGTFSEVIGDTEDGLFSRFAFYRFEGELEWRDQFGTGRETSLDQAVTRAADNLETVYRELDKRSDPLYITFQEQAERAVNQAGAFVMKHWKTEDVRPELYSSLKRAALRAVRIGVIIRLLKHHEQGKSLAEAQSVEVGMKSIETGLRLSFTYLIHSLRIGSQFGSKSDRSTLNREQRRYLDALPRGEFKTSDAKSIADDKGINKRTGQRWLKRWDQDTGLIEKVKTGVWQKSVETPSTKDVPGVIPVISVIRVIFGEDSVPEVSTGSSYSGDGAPTNGIEERNGVAGGSR